jgi:hypothetical protein
VFEKFTDRARRVVVLAQEESRLLNHNYIGTEHILLGLIHDDEGVAARTLLSLGIPLEDVRRQVEEIIGSGQRPPQGHIPFTPRAKKVLELSLREALQLGHNYIGTEHLLLGLVREGEGVAAQVLLKAGADLGRAREEVVRILSETPPEEIERESRSITGGRGIFRASEETVSGVGDEDELGPNCPHCRHPFPSGLTWERMEGVGEGSKRIAMVVVFCMECGTTIGVLPDTEPHEPDFPAAGPDRLPE